MINPVQKTGQGECHNRDTDTPQHTRQAIEKSIGNGNVAVFRGEQLIGISRKKIRRLHFSPVRGIVILQNTAVNNVQTKGVRHE